MCSVELLCFCLQGVSRFRAKIGIANTGSLALFQKLGYREVWRNEVFKEATLELHISEMNSGLYQDAWHRASKLEYD